MATGPPSEDWTKTFNTLKEFHDAAYIKLDEGIKLESEGKKDVALSKYEEGLRLMDLALELRVECPVNADLNWEKACVMLQKLRKTRKEVLGRIADVQVAQPQPVDPGLVPPPTYEEAMSLPLPSPSLNPSSSGDVNPSQFQSLPASTRRTIPNCGPMTYSELGDALNNLKVETKLQSAQVLYTFENVRMYFIHPDGTVSAPSEPSTLRVLQLEDGADEVARYFLQVGEWFYPLIPDVSPCLRTNYGAFILPDVSCDEDGAAVGLILPPDTDQTMSDLLQDLLHIDVPVETVSPPLSPALQRDDSTSATVTRGLISGEHKHRKKFLLKHGRHRHHRHKESHSSNVDRTEDENYEEDFKKQRHGRRHRHGHHGHRRHGHKDTDDKGYGEPPPYDEIGQDAKTLGNEEEDEEEEIEEIAGVEVNDSERSSKSYGRGKYSRRHKRHVNYDRNGYTTRIDRGANFISSSLIRGAEKTSQFLNSSTPKLLEKVTPDPTPRQVSPTVAKGVKAARNVSGGAVAVTGYVAGKIGSATMSLGRYLAPHIQKQGTRLLSTAGGMDEKTASERVGGILQVAAGAVEGLGTVYAGLEESASILGKSLSDNTVQVVQHKYGQPMGQVADDSLSTMGNVLAARQNAKFFTTKGFVRGAARGAGRSVLYDNQLGSPSNNNNASETLEKYKPNYKSMDKPGSPQP